MHDYKDQDVSQAFSLHNFLILFNSLFLRTRINDSMKFSHHVVRKIVKFLSTKLNFKRISIIIVSQFI